jgi:NAD(P)-dependent dehydrogenase (short-subunit alcohol dehydrogenase family)
MAREGADIVIADVNQERTAETLEDITALGRRAIGVRTDVSKEADLEALAERAVAEMGHVDLLMNNAGVVLGGPIEKIPLADWEWIIGINLLGPIRGVRAFLPHMLERGSGHIVNTASFAGLMAHNPLTIPYDTTKHGVVGFSSGLALYLRTNLPENYRFVGVDSNVAGRMPDAVVEADDLALKVVAAVRENRFLILSQPEHRDILVRRMQDIDRHIARQIEVLAAANA